jgi:RNA polymerase subunit RPABC4/transcription elongation factor Spt4
MEIFDQEKFNMLMERAAFGGVSPYDTSARQGFELPQLFTFPNEVIHWVASVTVDRIILGLQHQRGNTMALNVNMGVSPYRLVFFYDHIGMIRKSRAYCTSYWFQLDFEGRKWQRKKRRKIIYFTGVRMDKPEFKKGFLSRTIHIHKILTRDTGKTVKTFCGEISSIRWIDPATGKKVGRKAELVYNAIIDAFDNQVPVTATELVFLFEGPEYLEQYLSLTDEPEETEGRILKASRPEEKVEAAETTERVSPALEEAQPKEAGALACGSCGQVVQPGWKICPACGEPLSLICATCGQALERDWKLCPQCGAKPE